MAAHDGRRKAQQGTQGGGPAGGHQQSASRAVERQDCQPDGLHAGLDAGGRAAQADAACRHSGAAARELSQAEPTRRSCLQPQPATACTSQSWVPHANPLSAPVPHGKQAAFPTSKILVLNLLPRTSPDVDPVNVKLKALCVKRGIYWSTCGSDINPHDPKQLYDGTHPAQKGADKVLRCLAPEVARLAGKA